MGTVGTVGTLGFIVILCFCLYSVMGQTVVTPLTDAQRDALTFLQNNSDLVDIAVPAGMEIIVEYRGPSMTLIVQEEVSASFDCLPWASNFPGGSIEWYLQKLSEDLTPQTPDFQLAQEIPNKIAIGGTPPQDRWFNISRIQGTGGAADPDFGNYRCQVCVARGTPEEVCHNSTTLLYIAGAPPRIIKGDPDGMPDLITPLGNREQLTYRIGTNFCINPQSGNRYEIDCNVIMLPRPLPTLVTYSFSKNDEEVSRYLSTGDREITPSFFDLEGNNVLRGGELIDQEGNPLIPLSLASGQTHGVIFDLSIFNVSMSAMFLEPSLTMAALEEQVGDALLGSWTCDVSNAIGSDSARSIVRLCEPQPVFPGCGTAAALFPQNREVVSIGCAICIPRGFAVTIDCNAAPMDMLVYEWLVNNRTITTTSRTLTVTEEANYTCFARNRDHPNQMATSVIVYSDQINFQSNIRDFTGAEVPGNGCNRLFRSVADTDLCVFLGDQVQFTCTNAQTGEMLTVSDSDGNNIGSDFVDVMNTMFEDTYTCSLMAPGDCGMVEQQMVVRVFDPARIDREGPVVLIDGTIAVGRGTFVHRVMRGMDVTLICDTSGIDTPNTTWSRVDIPDGGCGMAVPITDGVSTTDGDSTLIIPNFGGDVDGNITVSYICNTENIAGRDADVVVVTTLQESVGWTIDTEFGNCSLMCRDGVRTRSVSCRDQDGRVLPDSACDALLRPASSVTCEDLFNNECLTTPIYGVTSFAPQCPSCGGGFQERDIFCFIPMTRTIVSDNECAMAGQRRPSKYQLCGDPCCVEDELPNACEFLGEVPAVKRLYCRMPSTAEVCCWTCRNFVGSKAP